MSEVAHYWPEEIVGTGELVVYARDYERLRAENIQLIEDRARFPDKPDFIGHMIAAHIGNLRAGKEQGQKYAASYRLRMARAEETADALRQQRDELTKLLREVKSAYTTATHWGDMQATMAMIDAALASEEIENNSKGD